MDKKKRPRIVVRQWMPTKSSYTLTTELLEKLMKEAFSKLELVIYAGWKAKRNNGKRIIQFVLATGKTMKEARTNFKTSEAIGENIWIADTN